MGYSKVYQVDDSWVFESNQDVCRLDIVVYITQLMKNFESLDQLDHYFEDSCTGKLFTGDLLQQRTQIWAVSL